MIGTLGRRRVDELCIRGLVKDSQECLKVPLLLLLCCPKGRRAAVLTIREPGALPETLLGRPNGAKDGLLKEFILEGKRPLAFTMKSTEMSTLSGVWGKY